LRSVGTTGAESGEILLKRSVSLLRGSEVPRLKGLPQRAEGLGDGVCLLGRRVSLLGRRTSLLAASAPVVVVMMVPLRLADSLLHVLLDGGIVLLRRIQITTLESLPESAEGLADGVVGIALRGGWRILRQRSKILLRLGQIAGL